MHKTYRYMALVVGVCFLCTPSVLAQEEGQPMEKTGVVEWKIPAPVSPITHKIENLRHPEAGVVYHALPFEFYDAKKEAWAEKRKGFELSAPAPLRLEADHIRYDGKKGEVTAKGDILIREALSQCRTEVLRGNTETEQYVFPEKVTWTTEGMVLQGASAAYDGKAGTATIRDMEGQDNGLYYFRGKEAALYEKDRHIRLEEAYITTKSALAKVPDYGLEVDTIDIYPGAYYVAKGLRLKIKNTTVLSLPKQRGKLNRKHSMNIWRFLPRPAFDSDEGWGFVNSMEVPFFGARDVSVYTENYWYRKSGYKPEIGIAYDPSWGSVTLSYANEKSLTDRDEVVWIEKKPVFRVKGNPISLIKDRLALFISGEVGKQKEIYHDRVAEGLHENIHFRLQGKPVSLGKYMSLHWNTGYMLDVYRHTDVEDREKQSVKRHNVYYTLGLYGGYGPVQGWVHYVDRYLSHESPYAYDRYSEKSPLEWGVKWEFTPRDALSVAWVVDTTDGRLTHNYITYYRDFHSFFGWVKYDTVKDRTEIKILAKDFDL